MRGTYKFLIAFFSLFIVGITLSIFISNSNLTGNIISQNQPSPAVQEPNNVSSQIDVNLPLIPGPSNTSTASNITLSNSSNLSMENITKWIGGGGGSSKGHGGGNSGNSGNSNNPPVNSSSNQSSNPSQSKNKSQEGKIKNLPSHLKLEKDGNLLQPSDLLSGKTHLRILKGNKRIAFFDLDVESDIDLSSIIADINDEGKVILHAPPGLLTNISLYLPINDSINAIRICSNASRFDQIIQNCSLLPEITSEEIIPLNSSRISLSEDNQYYIISGITGTGISGANVTAFPPETAPTIPPSNVSAWAGSVTEIIFDAGAGGTTRAWQGYFGNTSGTLQLTDAQSHPIYNWSIADPKGEVYASTNITINWNTLTCFNFTATGTMQNDDSQAGNTSLYGYNISIIESLFGIFPQEKDGVDETFSLSTSHDSFFASHLSFASSECPAVHISQFQETILYEPQTTSIVFAAIISQDTLGFNNRTHDFEMLVLENGHATDVSSTPYYFYVELQ